MNTCWLLHQCLFLHFSNSLQIFFPLGICFPLLSYTAGVEWTPYLVDSIGLKLTSVSHSLGEAIGSRMGIWPDSRQWWGGNYPVCWRLLESRLLFSFVGNGWRALFLLARWRRWDVEATTRGSWEGQAVCHSESRAQRIIKEPKPRDSEVLEKKPA